MDRARRRMVAKFTRKEGMESSMRRCLHPTLSQKPEGYFFPTFSLLQKPARHGKNDLRINRVDTGHFTVLWLYIWKNG